MGKRPEILRTTETVYYQLEKGGKILFIDFSISPNYHSIHDLMKDFEKIVNSPIYRCWI